MIGNPLNEQNNAIIALDGSHRRLPIITAWANSSSVFWVLPSFPTTAMQFKVGNADKTAWAATLKMCFHPKRGLWRIYIPGRYFTGRYETSYEIVVADEYGNRHVSGEGVLRVYASAIPDKNDSPSESPSENCYARFPDGKYRAVTVTEDEAGAPVFSIGAEVDGAAFEGEPKRIYAYNNATGLYHEVQSLVDEAGEASLSIVDEPSEDGEDCYVLNPATGFYHRIEVATDEAGELAMKTGEGKKA